jgi:hypothetical protein
MSQSYEDGGINTGSAEGALYPPDTQTVEPPSQAVRKRSRTRAQGPDTYVEGVKSEIKEAVTDKIVRHPSTSLLTRRSETRSLSAPESVANRTRQASEPDVKANGSNRPTEQTYSVDWLAIDASLTRVRQHVEIGRGVPELTRLKTPVRQLARAVAGAVLFVSRFLTNRQAAFNIAGLTALHQLAEGIRRMHLAYMDHIQRLEKQIATLQQEQERSTRSLAAERGRRKRNVRAN